MGKNKLKKILGNLLDKIRKFEMNETVIYKVLAFLRLKKILGNFCLSNNRWVLLLRDMQKKIKKKKKKTHTHIIIYVKPMFYCKQQRKHANFCLFTN